MKFAPAACAVLVLADMAAIDGISAQNTATEFLDRFTYNDETIVRQDGFMDYQPQEWNKIICNESDQLEECLGYRDKWETGRGWEIEKNYCLWCPEGEGLCNRHHQSPIDLKRAVGLDVFPWRDNYHPDANECIDIHWMKYEDSFCSLEALIESDAFTVERHGLRIAQPITVYDDWTNDIDGVVDGIHLECRIPGLGSRFGRIDFSKGFSQWWYLSHIDIHVPSEHTQEGKRYDAEIQLYHFYSVSKEATGTDTANEMAAVSVFMESYPDVAPYPYLDKVICQWRRKEFEVRQQCGLDPISTSYPGCFPLLQNDHALKDEENHGIRGLTGLKEQPNNKNTMSQRFRTVADAIYYNDMHKDNPGHKDVPIDLDPINFKPAEDKDWDSWIEAQSKRMKAEEELYHKMRRNDYGGDHTEDLHEKYRRSLIQGDNLEWFNYWPLLGVRTEYYYRYSGSQTIPPCYGNFQDESRKETNHWRVMKDPIRIHPRQLTELKRLVADRIAPPDDPVNPCQPDTAAKVSRDPETNEVEEVEAARPLMDWDKVHFKTFCECKDWASKWPEDRAWCLMEDIQERFYTHPYNYPTQGFELEIEEISVEPFDGK